MTTFTCDAKRFTNAWDASEYAAERGGDMISMPGGVYLAINETNANRLAENGGPETIRIITEPRRGGWVTIEAGRNN
ncbi:MAG: hypothetical protein L0Z07_10400 [Planctomycetes bacterium]|nr:hypothetical protein [Planctomycetota bacterium]